MAEQVGSSPSTDSFEYVLFEGDPDNMRTVVSTSNETGPWVDPGVLKLTHRIGRGPLGDVWIATLHQSTDDYDNYHEVAVKMLNSIKEDQMQAFMIKFEDIFSKLQGLSDVCFLHGVSIKSGKICIIMKFYEGSLADKMAQLEGDKLSLADVLRYGIDLAQGVLEMHSRGILILNLKPSNFLLNGNDQAIIGDIGLPLLLYGIPRPSSDMTVRLGTANYMAPEQWEPGVGGPISFETDSWGFGCSVVEMLTGIRPWSGKSSEEIHDLVVNTQEKPSIPSGLPAAIENVIIGCFNYDLRKRPLIRDILHAFKNPNAVYGDCGWISPGHRPIMGRPATAYSTNWLLGKDKLQVGDIVRSRKSSSFKQESMDIPEGMVVGMETDGDADRFILVRVHGLHDPLKLHPSTLERVTFGFAAGDWVRIREEDRKKHSPVGILHSIERDGRVTVSFIGMETLWHGNSADLQMSETFYVGQFVRVKANVSSPRFEWPQKKGGKWEAGRILRILPNGCLVVGFPGRPFFRKMPSFLADPAEVEVVSFDKCVGMVKKYQHLEDYHWVIRPVLIALGLLTALKLGFTIGKSIKGSRKKGAKVSAQGEGFQDGQSGANPAWLPSPVANILFRDGVAIAR
ncbi:E3 ubiquitin-protein ligase [Nymphaea thermarum]|nr:E3 ubiquitin-protein ligase [Nymphaea thermarum]